MLDNQLFKAIIAIILAGRAGAGLPDELAVKQAYQPRQQGVNSGPAAYIFKVGDRPRGCARKEEKYNNATSSFDHIETQPYETTFQVSALATQSPELTDALTASDILNLVRYILQNQMTVARLEIQGIGILRVEEVSNTPFIDDRQQFEYNPSFNFTLTHKQVIVSKTPAVTKTEVRILNV